VSRKTHGNGLTFDVDLPLSGDIGIECRKGQGANSDEHQVVITFPIPVSVGSASVSDGSVATVLTSGNQVFVNLTGVPNARRITIFLNNVNDGRNVANVTIPMGVLLGDVNGSGRVDSGDVFLVRQQTLQDASSSNFRTDLNISGRVDSGDVFTARQQTLTSLP
jgi:hypothetical protein